MGMMWRFYASKLYNIYRMSKHPFLPEGIRYFSSTTSTWGQARSRFFEQFLNFRPGAKPHVADGIPIDHKLIFRSSLRRYALAGYTAVVFSVPAYTAYIFYVLTDKDFLKKQTRKRDRQSFTLSTVEEFYAFVIFGGILLVFISLGALKVFRATLFRIYHNEKDGLYTAVRRDNFFRIQRIKFFGKDVQEAEMTERSLCNINIKGKGYIVPHDSFVSATAFNKFVNYKTRWDVGEKDISLRDIRSKFRK